MYTENYIFNGVLSGNGRQYAIVAAFGSKNSLLVNFDDDCYFKDNTAFDQLALQIRGDSFEFGKCVFHYEASSPNFVGRLIFLSDVYDFYKILTTGTEANLTTYFQNISLVLAQKKKIREEFRDYTSDLTYDLRVYRKYFDELDATYRNEPAEIYKIAQNTIIESEGRKFFAYFDEKLRELEKVTAGFSQDEHESHAYFFRRQVWDFIGQSKFLTRTNSRPRGYAGDSEMMSMIYRDLYEGDTIFAKLMHKHPIETASAEAVRNRKIIIPEILLSARQNFPEVKKDFKILSVAAGSARELENFIVSPQLCQDYLITLLDQDNAALNEAANALRRIENRFSAKINFRFINESVRTMLRTRDLAGAWGQYHFIYSMGLFDYLSTRVAEAVLEKIYSLLLPGATLIVGNYHEANPTKTYMDYWGDWVLYYRSEEDFLALAAKLDASVKKVIFEDTGCQMFLILQKPLPA